MFLQARGRRQERQADAQSKNSAAKAGASAVQIPREVVEAAPGLAGTDTYYGKRGGGDGRRQRGAGPKGGRGRACIQPAPIAQKVPAYLNRKWFACSIVYSVFSYSFIFSVIAANPLTHIFKYEIFKPMLCAV